MGTMYFVLGMLSIIAAAIVSVLVWGVVKINKQQLGLDSIQHQMEQASREVQDGFVEMYRELDQRGSWTHQRIDECEARMNRRVDESDSYTDSRIDKVLGSRIDKVLGTAGINQVIKG